MTHQTFSFFGALALLVAPLSCAQAQLIVHEWGTMTTLHAPDGQPQTRMNLIEQSELLPASSISTNLSSRPTYPMLPSQRPYRRAARSPAHSFLQSVLIGRIDLVTSHETTCTRCIFDACAVGRGASQACVTFPVR
jgi:hypothetical protein